MKRSKILSLLLVLVLALGLFSGCGQKAAADPVVKDEPKEEGTPQEEPKDDGAVVETDSPAVTLVYAEVNPLDTIVGQFGLDFKEKVEEISGGNITIDIQHSGVLGSEEDVLDSMLGGGGTIDMSRISAFALTSYGGAKSKMLSIPFIFESREHFWNFADSDLAPEFLEEPYENGSGIRGLWYGEEGFRHFFFRNEVKGIDDLKGLKLRISNDPVMTGMVSDLGAAPTVIAFGELYSSLQTGVVDGAEQPIANYRSNSFPEVAPTIILDGHTLGAIQVVITDEAWDKLTEEQQNWIMEAGAYASAQNRANSEAAENEVLKLLEEEGVNIVPVDDKTPWQEAVKPTVESAIKGYEDLYQQILDLK